MHTVLSPQGLCCRVTKHRHTAPPLQRRVGQLEHARVHRGAHERHRGSVCAPRTHRRTGVQILRYSWIPGARPREMHALSTTARPTLTPAPPPRNTTLIRWTPRGPVDSDARNGYDSPSLVFLDDFCLSACLCLNFHLWSLEFGIYNVSRLGHGIKSIFQTWKTYSLIFILHEIAYWSIYYTYCSIYWIIFIYSLPSRASIRSNYRWFILHYFHETANHFHLIAAYIQFRILIIDNLEYLSQLLHNRNIIMDRSTSLQSRLEKLRGLKESRGSIRLPSAN